MKIEIKRHDDDLATYWSLWVNDKRVTDCFSFRKVWNAAKRFNADTANYILDPLDK